MRHAFSAILLAVASTTAFAQGQTTSPILTLDEAVTLAIRNNPTHLRSISAQVRAGAATRTAYGAFLPTINSTFGSSFRAGGAEIVAGQQQGSASDILSSSYRIDVSASYSAATFLQPSVAKANENAAEAEVTSSAANTRRDVVTQYLNVLQAQASTALQDTLVANAQAQLDLIRARESVGAATSLDGRRSEVTLGNARVNQLREKNNAEIEMLRLFQIMGVQRVEGTRLTTAFPVVEPQLDLNQLLRWRSSRTRCSMPQSHGSRPPAFSLARRARSTCRRSASEPGGAGTRWSRQTSSRKSPRRARRLTRRGRAA
jgi:outer membrane protein